MLYIAGACVVVIVIAQLLLRRLAVPRHMVLAVGADDEED